MRSRAAVNCSTADHRPGCCSLICSSVAPADRRVARSKLTFVRAPATAALRAPNPTTTGIIESLSDIRWDLRPSPRLGTLENRVCDGMSDLGEVAAVTALAHCVVVDLDTRLAGGETLPTMPPWQVQENKWRAARYGLDAIVIVDDSNRERLVTEDLDDLLDRLTPVARRLGCEDELRSVADIPTRGASYQRQRAVARESGGDLVAVVDALVAELAHSLKT